MDVSREIRTGKHVVFDIHVHLVFVTKYRHNIFNKNILADLENIFSRICEDFEAEFEYDCSAVLTGHTQDVKCVRFHPSSSKHLFSASYDDTVKLWVFDQACEDWIESYSISGVHSSTVWALDFDPSG